ncbi:MAG: DUF1553 domain-containing protein [Bryobacteraceae bacterium]
MRILQSLVVSSAIATAAPAVDFNREVRPILSENCFTCHGPDAHKRMANLRLDTREGLDGARVLARIAHQDKARRMPPPSSGRSLTEKQIATIRTWIEQGAKWEPHWSYVPPQSPPVPGIKVSNGNEIDAFVRARLAKEGLRPSPEASRGTLLRRLSFDLTGLPPSPAELAAFLADRSANAYEKAVDRLLASEHYGEKMALQWLDIARYADTHGYHIDSHRDMWPWRDWVIAAFNRNQRFDEFTVEQIAGDLLPDPTRQQLIATGFNRNHMINFEGGAIDEEYHTELVVDRVEATATAWLGMTMGCARCHDHKYDPISQKDFYRFFAFFNNVDEVGLDGRRGNAKPFLVVDPGNEGELDEIDAEIKALGERLSDKAMKAPRESWEPRARQAVPEMQRRLANGLAAHYTFDGGLGDSSGHYRQAALDGKEPSFTGGAAGKALALNLEDRLELDDGGSIRAGGPFTLAFHMRPAHERGVRLFERGEGADAIEAYSEESRYVPYYKRGAPLHFRFGGVHLATKAPVLFSATSHLALTYDGDRFALFVDARPMPLEVVAEGAPAFGGDGPLRFTGFQGNLDDLRIYSRVLGAGEIEDLAIHLPARVTAWTPEKDRSRDDKTRVLEYFLHYAAGDPVRSEASKLDQLRARREELGFLVPTTMIMKEREELRPTYVLGRGDYSNKGELVTAAVPAALPPLPQGAPANRLGLARWLVSPENPLTARVAVNRFWQIFFGQGLVKSSEDFGSQGEPPSHPELLDYLAAGFASNWDVKALVKKMVMSATYRQVSSATLDLIERDPENRLLARMSRFRLPAELVRDSALASSGLLNAEVGGRSVLPYQPPGLWEEMAFGREFTAQRYEQSHGRDLYRRSMYTFWKRTVPPAAMSTFDAPDREKCTARRPVTNTPLQALVLMNDPTYIEAARHLAAAMLGEARRDDDRIAAGYRRVLARDPAKRELTVWRRVLAKQRATYEADPDAAAKLLANGESTTEAPDRAELAAWTNVASMLLSLDEAITKE